MVFFIAEIDAPYSEDNSLPVGTFVEAIIPTIETPDSLETPEISLVNDSFLWAVSESQTLVKVNVQRLYSHRGMAYIKLLDTKLSLPLSVVVKPLTNFRTGMLVKAVAQ